MTDQQKLVLGNPEGLWDPTNRRTFLKLMAVGGSVVFLPTMVGGCRSRNSITDPTEPGTGMPVTIDFSKGDTAVLQFALALEQLEADYYTRVVANFSGSDLTVEEKDVLTDLKYHEVLHRDFLRQVLGAEGTFTLTPTYPGVNFRQRTSVLNTAKTFEFLGVAAYNGAAQYLSNVNNLLAAGKIVSVEARHASAIADLLAPRTNAFAPQAFADVFSPQKVAGAAQGFLVDRLMFANPPSTFVQGPNNNG